MERIEFKYTRTDEFEESFDDHEVKSCTTDKNDEGLRSYNVCEMFMDFMESAGFGKEEVLKFFSE